MKILFVMNGANGDLTPFINIGLRLKSMGHDVVYAIPEDSVIQMAEYDLEYKTYMKLAEESRPDYRAFIFYILQRLHGDSMNYFDAVNAVADDIDLVIRNPHAALGTIIADYHNVPCVDIFISPMFFSFDEQRRENFNNLFLEKTNELRTRLQLPKSNDVPVNVWWHDNLKIAAYPEFYVNALKADPRFSDNFSHPNIKFANFSPLVQDFELDAATEEFLLAGDPPVCFDMGTGGTVMTDPKNLWEIAYELGKNEKRMIILHEQGDFPDHPNIHFLPGIVPHHRLFPRCSLVINHGGMGTIGKCIASNVPQVCIPQMDENVQCAELMSDMLVSLRPSEVTYEKIADLIRDPKYNLELAKERGDYIRNNDGVDMIIEILREYKYLNG